MQSMCALSPKDMKGVWMRLTMKRKVRPRARTNAHPDLCKYCRSKGLCSERLCRAGRRVTGGRQIAADESAKKSNRTWQI